MCLSSVMLWSISLWRYFREVVGVNVGIFCACCIHCVSSGVGRRGNFSSVLCKWAPLVVLSRYRVLVIGDLIQSCWVMRGRFSDPPCLASMYFVNPLYIFPSRPLSLRAFMSCSPMHVIYAFFSENASVPNITWGSCVTAFDIHFGRPHMVLCKAITFLSSFLMAGSE